MSLNVILYLLVILLAYIVQAVTGFGGPLLTMPFGILLVGMDRSKAVLCVISCLSSLLVVLQDPKSINWKEAGKILVGMFVGMLVGLWLYDVAPRKVMLLVYGAFTVLVACKNLFIKKRLALPKWALLPLLPLAGLAQGLFVSGGAFLMMYAIEALPDKRQFRMTCSLIWTVLNGYMIYSQAQRGLYTAATVTGILLPAVGATLVAVWAGTVLQGRLDQRKFNLLVNALLLVTGITLLLS